MSQPSASVAESTSRARREATHEDIARRARALWEQYGRPAGRDEQIWLEAERQLRGLELTPHRMAEQLAYVRANGSGDANGHANGHSAHAYGSRRANGRAAGHVMPLARTGA